MTKNHEDIAESTWFLLVGDKVLLLAVFASLAPFAWALLSIHAGEGLIGSIVFVVWSGLDGWALWELHRRKYLRLLVSLPCTVMGVLAVILGVWST